ncbi:Cyclopropane-fatty-acyl-phospholipid synthase [Adhaeretor mobilis]|uniref:Cyclopropane-fatty-acyl-phospholipid synthase n=1 Tax=Adhaeretor mobilis TaxID=1930276 RepID=A0A517MT02_9BACT|nr:Cyclopropane-fatty-acyl-phospholipid synthase [Adhaeretor mobilis]
MHQRLEQLGVGPLRITDSLGEATLAGAGCSVLDQSESFCSCRELVVTHPRFYRKIVTRGSLGFGDAYVDGDWNSPDLPALLETLAEVSVEESNERNPTRLALSAWQRLQQLLNRNSPRGSRRNISFHYDLSNQLFALFLDPTFTYSCGIFSNASTTLEEASLAKYQRICEKLELSPRDHVLEIGCGWGGFVEYAVQHYGCRVTAVTISREQLNFAKQRIAATGLADRVDLQFCDYRHLTGKFDKLVSIEMIEAVGHDYLPAFVEKCDSLLKPSGKMMLQAITIPDHRYDAYRRRVDFIQKYIFPGGCLVSLERLARVVHQHSTLRELQSCDFAADYQKMLLAWREKFLASREQVRALHPGDRFLRAWDYYFSYCAAGFARGKIGVSQILLEKDSGTNQRTTAQ